LRLRVPQENSMRIPVSRTLKLSLATLVVAAAVSACADARATDADADLQRDLALASSTVSLAAPAVDPALLNSMETEPKGAPEKAPVLKKAEGSRAVRSRTPTVRAAPVEELAAAEETEEVAEVMDEAPTPEESTEPVAIAPRPEPVVIETAGAGDYGTGNGGVWGNGGRGGIGVILGGGGIDGDNCELHRRRRPGTYSGPVFVPQAPIPTTGGTSVNLPRPTGRVGSSSGRMGSGSGMSSRGPVRVQRAPSIATRSGRTSPRGR
jgi:hypothetical protein